MHCLAHAGVLVVCDGQVVAVEPVADVPALRVDQTEHAVCVVVLRCREEDQLVVSAQFFEELFEVRPEVHFDLRQERLPSQLCQRRRLLRASRRSRGRRCEWRRG